MSPVSRGPEGYPDYQRVANADGPALIPLTTQTFEGEILYGPFEVSRYRALQFAAVILAKGNVHLELVWKSAEAGGSILARRSIYLSEKGAAALQANIANLGPWLEIKLIAVKTQISFSAYASNRNPLLEFTPIEPVPLIFAGKIAPKATKVIYPLYYCSGPARLRFNAGVIGVCSVEALTAIETWTIIDIVTGTEAAPKQEQDLILPSTACRLTLENTAASESELTAVITPSPTGSS